MSKDEVKYNSFSQTLIIADACVISVVKYPLHVLIQVSPKSACCVTTHTTHITFMHAFTHTHVHTQTHSSADTHTTNTCAHTHMYVHTLKIIFKNFN